MKIKILPAVLLVGCLICMAGCSLNASEGKTQAESSEKEVTEAQEDATENEGTHVSSKRTVAKKKSVAEDTTVVTAEASTENSVSRPLSQTELDEFTAWSHDIANYGLLLSDYTNPSGVDLNEVFYNGAGLPQKKLTDDEINTYLGIVGQNEIETDITALTGDDINDYLDRRLGITLNEANNSLTYWTYLPKTDVWILEHGDTNQRLFQCIDGNVTNENKYVLKFESIDDFSGNHYTCETTLVKNKKDYKVLSNSLKKSIVEEETTQFNSTQFDNDYIIYGSDWRYITKEEIQSLSKEDLRIARNEIYARHGRLFSSADLQQYFNSKTWYSGSIPSEQFDESTLNEYEKANLTTIQKVENTK